MRSSSSATTTRLLGISEVIGQGDLPVGTSGRARAGPERAGGCARPNPGLTEADAMACCEICGTDDDVPWQRLERAVQVVKAPLRKLANARDEVQDRIGTRTRRRRPG